MWSQAAADVYIVGEVVTLNHSMHRSFAAPEGPLTGLLNFPVVEHFSGPEIWGKGQPNPSFPAEKSADMSNLRYLLRISIEMAISGFSIENSTENRPFQSNPR